MLKEDWSTTDIFNYNKFNEIITNLIQLCNIHRIEIDSQLIATRPIKIGDNLSGKKIYIDLNAKETFDNFIATQWNNVDILRTENNGIFEEIYYSGGFYKTICTDDYIELFEYSEEDYLINRVPSVNLNELILDNNFGTVNYINLNSNFYKKITIEKEEFKERGDFIYANELNGIENTLNTMCSRFHFAYNKRIWYRLSVISYKDINRWCKTINLLNNLKVNKYSEYTGNKYSDLFGRSYYDLMYEGGQ